jgi:transposase
MRPEIAVQGMLAGMPEAGDLSCTLVEDRMVVAVGQTVLFEFATADYNLRNLVAVSLTSLGFTGRRVAEVFGISEEYVSMLRGRIRRDGSAALSARRGRPPTISARDLAAAHKARAAGKTDRQIAASIGVHATTIARALVRTAKVEPELAELAPTQQSLLPLEAAEAGERQELEPVSEDLLPEAPLPEAPLPQALEPVLAGTARIGTATLRSGYGGAMLLYPYLSGVGASSILSPPAGGKRFRYDDLAVAFSATLGFALGAGTIEGTKHLRRADVGAVLGITAMPELSSLRSRLGEIGDRSDPLELIRRCGGGMLAFDPSTDPVYFVDDHFVAYSGTARVQKGWNTRRRHAEPGRDDTFLVDSRGRAVVFHSGPPTSLASNLPATLAELRQVIGPDAPVLLGFDRGGSYPVAFSACRDAGADWVSYRRAPLVASTATPKRSWTLRDGKRLSVILADEKVELKNYGSARQLTLYESGRPVLQVLTSMDKATGAALLYWLRARWRIENMFKYAASHNGINALADYRMEIRPDDRLVANPERIAARENLADAEATLVAAERALPQLLDGPLSTAEKNAQLPAASAQIASARRALEDARQALRPIPAKVAANVLDENAIIAEAKLERRGLQMVLRMLAFNAEAYTAEHFNTYLADKDEYRAILRNLLHHPATITYAKDSVTVVLDEPDSPRVARSLHLLAEELSTHQACIPGDNRPIIYRVGG